MKQIVSILLLSAFLLSTPLHAQKKKNASSVDVSRLRGLYVSVDAGLLVADSKHAQFYSGNPAVTNNTIDRVLRSEQYGNDIWNNLVNASLISPSAIGSYRDFQVVEYPTNMYYKLTYQIGVGIRYVKQNQWGWMLRFDYSQLSAAGRFNISSDNGTGVLGANQYITCDVFGIEKRTLIDFGILKRVPFSDMIDLEFAVGFDLNSTTVQNNAMRIAGHTYKILDVWGGNTPTLGMPAYEYMNEGRVGIGGFGSVAVSYLCNVGSIDLGYNLYYMQTRLADFCADNPYALQHNIFLRFSINKIKFFD